MLCIGCNRFSNDGGEIMLRIERVTPRPGAKESPILTSRGYELADRRAGREANKVANATFVRTLEEAVDLIENGSSIRMGAPGK